MSGIEGQLMFKRKASDYDKDGYYKYVARDYAKKQELDAAKQYGGFGTARSGAGNIKGDVRVKGKYRIECKCTTANVIPRVLTYEYMENFVEQAKSLGEEPFIQLHFIDKMGIKKRGYIIIPEENIKDYLSAR